MNMEESPAVQPESHNDFDIVGITGMSHWKDGIANIAEQFKASTVIVGGSWASLYPKEALSIESIDYVCLGEGERVWKDFLQKFPAVDGIEGLGYRDAATNEIKLNSQKTRIMNLNELPMPAWDLVHNLNKYQNVSVYTSRGCPYNCIFCSDNTMWGHEWRAKDPDIVVKEIEQLVNVHKVNHIVFNDENMTMNPKRFEQICQGVIDKKIKVNFSAVQGVRVDRLPKSLLQAMKNAGFKSVAFSPESGCQRVLNEVIHKNLDLSTVEPVIKTSCEIGLNTQANFVVGFPDEKMEEVEETIQFADRLRALGCNVYVGNAIPFPDTELYRKAKADGRLLYDGEKLTEITSYPHKPRKIHCFSSPHWKPEEIIEICKKEYKKDLKALTNRTPKSEILLKSLRHPVKAINRVKKMI